MKKTYNLNILFFFMIFLASSAIAATPTYYNKIDESLPLSISCSVNDTLPCSISANCSLTLYAPNGTAIYNKEPMQNMNNSIMYLNLSGFASYGEYKGSINCTDNTDKGFSSFSININNSGDGKEPNALIAILTLIPFIAGLIFLIGGISLNPVEHPATKIFLFLVSLCSIIFALYLGTLALTHFYVFTDMQEALTTSTYIFSILIGVVITYFIIYLIYKTIQYTAEKKEERLEY